MVAAAGQRHDTVPGEEHGLLKSSDDQYNHNLCGFVVSTPHTAREGPDYGRNCGYP